MSQKRYYNYRYADYTNGRKPAEEFLMGLSPADQTKFQSLWTMVAYTKQYHNNERLKKLNTSEGIWQFRAGDCRMLAYQSGNCYVLTNGFKKDQNKTNPKLIELAIKIKKYDMNIKIKGQRRHGK